ncbi:hypothetical protein M9458_008914, partial [Cirrhinus mrigala]
DVFRFGLNKDISSKMPYYYPHWTLFVTLTLALCFWVFSFTVVTKETPVILQYPQPKPRIATCQPKTLKPYRPTHSLAHAHRPRSACSLTAANPTLAMPCLPAPGPLTPASAPGPAHAIMPVQRPALHGARPDLQPCQGRPPHNHVHKGRHPRASPQDGRRPQPGHKMAAVPEQSTRWPTPPSQFTRMPPSQTSPQDVAVSMPRLLIATLTHPYLAVWGTKMALPHVTALPL